MINLIKPVICINTILQWWYTTKKSENGFTQPFPDLECSWDMAKCTSGKCIYEKYVCDGYNDCHDESDENEMCQGKGVKIKDVVLQKSNP